jgi:Ca-activated chloride channel family protein
MKNLKSIFLTIFSLLLAFSLWGSAAAQEGGPVIRITQQDSSRFPQVTVYVSVTDANGEPLGVDPNQIQITENGQVMQPEQISGSGEIGTLTTMLVMDVSGSMNNAGKLSAAKSAAEAYVDQMRPGDLAGLLTFNTKVTYVQQITSSHQLLKGAIENLKAKNDTAMYDAVEQAAQILEEYSGRKAIIVLTDGLDNQSKHTAVEISQTIGTSGLSISTIGLGNPDNAGPYFGLDESALQSLAEKDGGVYSQADNAAALRALYERLGRALQSEYRITYTSPSALRDGQGRTLTVSLGEAASAQVKYNPGGILPEVARQASFLIFILVLAVLVALIFVPALLSRFPLRKAVKAEQSPPPKPSGRIKLK